MRTLKFLKDRAGERVRRFLDDPLLRDYEDTLRRLVRGDFADLTLQERREKVEQVLRASAGAAMATGSAPVPFLELPVQWAMVRAIARIHGVKRPGKALLWELVGALGGGLFLRQVMRLLPLGGALPHLSRIYGATWALGRVAEAYFERGAIAAGRGSHLAIDDELHSDDEAVRNAALQNLFRNTAEDRTRDQSRRFNQGDLEARLHELDDLRNRSVLTHDEYRRKRAQLIADWPPKA